MNPLFHARLTCHVMSFHVMSSRCCASQRCMLLEGHLNFLVLDVTATLCRITSIQNPEHKSEIAGGCVRRNSAARH